MQGTVKWFNDAKGYGFITSDETSEDIFVHHTAISADGYRTLTAEAKVEFEVTNGPKGKLAKNVRVVV